jgi:hypothetical protein
MRSAQALAMKVDRLQPKVVGEVGVVEDHHNGRASSSDRQSMRLITGPGRLERRDRPRTVRD